MLVILQDLPGVVIVTKTIFIICFERENIDFSSPSISKKSTFWHFSADLNVIEYKIFFCTELKKTLDSIITTYH